MNEPAIHPASPAIAQEGRWPTFLVIGAARCGTTTVHGVLSEHPQIRMPSIKEPCFFTLRVLDVDLSTPDARKVWAGAVADEREYRALFADADTSNICAYGECSPVYLAIGETADSIARSIPDVRLIAILRDPVERAISHHAHNVGLGVEAHTNFAAALAADDAAGGWQYFRQGCYARMLSPYLWRFGSGQLLLVDYRRLFQEPEAAFARIWDHIGVDRIDLPETMPRILPTSPVQVSDEVRAALAHRYRKDTRSLIRDIGFAEAMEWTTA